MKSRLLFFLTILLYIFTINSFGQSFESLKRSKGKSVLYAAVEGTLAGSKPVQECLQAISTGELAEPYNGKTPIYLVLDYLAKHPKSECGNAEQLLNAFVAHRDFNVNLRYGSLLPPLAYLIRENHSFLGGKFSKDYISDHVFKKLIEAGASVNTYNSEGESLMTFAIETGNEYLQTYFINKGVNLQYTDSEGNNAIHLAINKADVGLLNQMVSRGSKIDVHSFQNNTEEMRNKQPELYAFLANECSRHAETYDDIVLFQKKFSNKKTLVQQKYEALAQVETNNANDIKTINSVRSRYPDLGKITDSKKLSIYRKDVAEIERINREMVFKAIENNIYFPESGKVGEFLSEYKNYDPDNKLSIAQEISDFYFVCRVLAQKDQWNNKKNDDYYFYTSWKKRRLLGLIPVRSWDDEIVSSIRYGIDNAEKIMKSTSKHGYDSFYKRRLSEMDDVRAAFNRHIDRCYKEYFYGSLSASDRITITKVTHPSGKLTTGLFETYYYHENNGEIKLKSGRSVYYNAFYRLKNGGDFVGYEVTNTFNVRFKKNSNVFGYHKTVEELVNTVANALE